MTKKTRIMIFGVILLLIMGGVTAAAIIMSGVTTNTGDMQMEQENAAAITKDGMFAVIETDKGSITLELF